MKIRRGLEVSTHVRAAAEAFDAGLERILAGDDGSETCMLAAADADPEFALPRFALGLPIDGKWPLTPLERSHLGVESESDAVAHVERFPADVWMFDKLHGRAFFSGSAAIRARVAGLAAERVRQSPDDPYYAARRASFLVESGDAQGGLELLDRVVTRDPRSLTAKHSRIHALHGLRRHDEVADVCAGVEGRGGKFRSHFAWHRALVLLSRGEFDDAVTLYATRCGPTLNEGAQHLALADLAGFAWSFRLATGELPPDVAALASAYAASARLRQTPFVALQRAALGAVAGCVDSPHSCFAKLQRAAFRRHWADVDAAIVEIAPRLETTGGSRLQRAVAALVHAWALCQRGRLTADRVDRIVPYATTHPVVGARALCVAA